MKFMWRPEECTAGAVYLCRILWLDKKLLEKLCYLAFLIYWFAVRRNRCLSDSCGYIFNWAWRLLKFGWMLFNIFKHTSVEGCLHATSLTTPRGGEELWGTHRNVSPSPFPPLYASRSTHAKCPQKPCMLARLRPFIPSAVRSSWPHVLVVPWSPAGERMGCCYGSDTVGFHELQLAQSFLLFPAGGKGWVQFPLEGMGSWRILLGKMSPLTTGGRSDRWWQSTVVIVGTNWISETGRERFTFQKQWADGE